MSLSEHLIYGGPVLLILFFVSVVALALVILKFIGLRRMQLNENFSPASISGRIETNGIPQALEQLRSHPSPLARVSARTIELCTIESDELTKEERERELELFGVEEVRRMESGLGAIAVAAHLSPLLGLLGTVMGMITAFQALEKAGLRADPSVLAGGIWEALLTTAFGLIIAIPLLAVHHYFQSRIDEVVHRMELLGAALLRRYRPREETNANQFGQSPLRAAVQ